MMLQSLQCSGGGDEEAQQRAVPPARPREQAKVVQWNLRSSLPSATHLGFLPASSPALLAFSFTASLCCSNLLMVLSELCTLSILSILHTGAFFFSQLDWKMISTMFLLVSSAPSSETACLVDLWSSRESGLTNTSSQSGQEKTTAARVRGSSTEWQWR